MHFRPQPVPMKVGRHMQLPKAQLCAQDYMNASANQKFGKEAHATCASLITSEANYKGGEIN